MLGRHEQQGGIARTVRDQMGDAEGLEHQGLLLALPAARGLADNGPVFSVLTHNDDRPASGAVLALKVRGQFGEVCHGGESYGDT